MLAPWQFDELYVVSDLHFGGKAGFQIFGATAELRGLVEQLTKAQPAKQIALLINGDFIDFLAEEPSTHFDTQAAAAKLQRVIEDPAFKPVFEALRAFIAQDKRTLIVNLGNHDLELALPWVRRHLENYLSASQPAARARLQVVTDGTGVRCAVGKASVLCVHGNEVDAWNVADFEKIRRIARDLQYGKAVEAWVPNAGTQMVIDVMNEVKRAYPFVDLLKPEAEAVVPTLIALDPAMLGKLRGVAAAAGRRSWDAARLATGFLGDEPQAGQADAAPVRVAMYPEAVTTRATRERAAQLIQLVEQERLKGHSAIDLVRAQQTDQLGIGSALWDALRGRPRHEVLREALESLDKDRSFDFAQEDETFRRLDELAAPEIDFLVAGHTHLQRALKRKRGQGYYFNSGTWARLMQIKPEVRADAKQFEALFDALKNADMAALDKAKYAGTRCTVVAIVAKPDGSAYGELRLGAQLKAEAGSRLPQ